MYQSLQPTEKRPGKHSPGRVWHRDLTHLCVTLWGTRISPPGVLASRAGRPPHFVGRRDTPRVAGGRGTPRGAGGGGTPRGAGGRGPARLGGGGGPPPARPGGGRGGSSSARYCWTMA